MSSVSSGGSSVVTLQFDLSLSLDIAEQQVQAAINAASNLLPASLPAPPIYAKVNPADAPVITLAVSSRSLPITQLVDMSEPASPRRFRNCPASVWSASPAASARPCACRPICRSWRRWG